MTGKNGRMRVYSHESKAMQRWFESRLDPFPDTPPAQPPATLYAFCRHYTRGAEPWLLVLTIPNNAPVGSPAALLSGGSAWKAR